MRQVAQLTCMHFDMVALNRTCCVCMCSVAELEKRCQLLSTELSELRQSLTTEQLHRSHTEDLLHQAREQLQIQQQLTARTDEQVSVGTGEIQRHLTARFTCTQLTAKYTSLQY